RRSPSSNGPARRPRPPSSPSRRLTNPCTDGAGRGSRRSPSPATSSTPTAPTARPATTTRRDGAGGERQGGGGGGAARGAQRSDGRPGPDGRSERVMKVILNLGMGVESSAILARLLLEPDVRDFELADLVVVTAQTGDEFSDTAALVEAHLLPLMRRHGVR